MANMIHYTHMRYLEDSIHKEGEKANLYITGKYYKQLAYALAHQMSLMCNKMINHGLFSLHFKFFWFENAF